MIQEQTGHKSNAVMLYKKSNLKMKKEASDMLNVLPSQMQAIRHRENVMLENKRKQNEPVSVSSKEIEHERLKQVSEPLKVETKIDVHANNSKKEEVVVDTKKGVPIMPGFDLSNLSGLVNIHFHFHAK